MKVKIKKAEGRQRGKKKQDEGKDKEAPRKTDEKNKEEKIVKGNKSRTRLDTQLPKLNERGRGCWAEVFDSI